MIAPVESAACAILACVDGARQLTQAKIAAIRVGSPPPSLAQPPLSTLSIREQPLSIRDRSRPRRQPAPVASAAAPVDTRSLRGLTLTSQLPQTKIAATRVPVAETAAPVDTRSLRDYRLRGGVSGLLVENPNLCFSVGFRMRKEHMRLSSTDMTAPALSNSPQ